MHARAIDPHVLAELRSLDGGGLSVGQLVQTFLDEAAQLLGKIDAAAARGNADALRDAAHYLRSGALTLGADTVAGVCEQLIRCAAAGDVERTRLLRRSLHVHLRRTAEECVALLQAPHVA